MRDLPVSFEWETCIGSVEPYLSQGDAIPPGDYVITLDTLNGDSIVPSEQLELQLTIADSYTMIGGHKLHNAYLDGNPVVVGLPSFRSQVTIYNHPHDFRLRSKPWKQALVA